MTRPFGLRHPSALAGIVACVLAAACTGDSPVVPPPPPVIVKAVTLASDSAQLLVGDSLTLTATVTDSRGATSQAFPVTWTSANPTVLSSAGNGRFVAVSPGVARIVATAQGVSATARVSVVEVARMDDVVDTDSAFTVLSTAAEIATGTLRIRPTAGGTSPIAVGDVVFGSADGGFLEKVTAVRSAGQEIVLSTAPAKLTDAIREGSIKISEDIDVGAELALALRRHGRAALALPAGISIDGRGNVVFDDADLIFETGGSFGGLSANMRLNGTLEIQTGSKVKAGTKSFDLGVEIVPCLPLACVERIQFGTVVGVVLNGSVETTIAGSVGGRVGVPLKKIPMGRKKIFNIPLRGQCLAGSLFCYGLFAVLEAYAEVEAAAHVTMTRGLNLKAGVDAGFTWTESKGFVGRFDPITAFSQTAPVYTIGGEAGVRFGLEPKLLFTVFGRGELSAGLDAAVQATIEAGSDYEWSAEIRALIDAFARAQVDVLGLSATYEPGRLRLWSTQLAGAKGDLATLSLSPTQVTMQETAQQTVTATARMIIGNFDLGITPQQLDWSVSPASVATVSANGVVTGVQAGSATLRATIRGTSISAQVPLTVTQRSLQISACFLLPGWGQFPPGGVCPTQPTTPFFARGATTYDLFVQVRQPGGVPEQGVALTVRDPFTNAPLTPTATFPTHQVFRFTIPANQTLGVTRVVVGPATKAGFGTAATVDVPFEVVIGNLVVAGCMSKDARQPFNSTVHCPPNGAPPGTAGETFYLWFGVDFQKTARCGATVTISNPFTGTSTDYLIPVGTPNCLARVAIPVPAGTAPRDYFVTLGPGRLQGYGDGAPLTFPLRIQ